MVAVFHLHLDWCSAHMSLWLMVVPLSCRNMDKATVLATLRQAQDSPTPSNPFSATEGVLNDVSIPPAAHALPPPVWHSRGDDDSADESAHTRPHAIDMASQASSGHWLGQRERTRAQGLQQAWPQPSRCAMSVHDMPGLCEIWTKLTLPGWLEEVAGALRLLLVDWRSSFPLLAC